MVLGGLADTFSTLTHLGARDLDPVTGTFTKPDPVLKLDEAKNFSTYVYGEADAINNADPSGLMILGPAIEDGGSWFGGGADVGVAAPTSRLDRMLLATHHQYRARGSSTSPPHGLKPDRPPPRPVVIRSPPATWHTPVT